MTEAEKRNYIRSAFKDYAVNKRRLNQVAMPGTGGVDYTRPSVVSGGGNGVETAMIKYIDSVREISNKCEIVRRTMEHYLIEDKRNGGKGKREYIYQHFVRKRSTYLSALRCNIAERTTRYWQEEIYLTAEVIAEQYNLFP